MSILPSFGTYSKFVNGAIGLAVGAGLSFAASKGLATCSVAADGSQACNIFGFSDSQITGAIMSIFALLFVHQSPPNTPPS